MGIEPLNVHERYGSNVNVTCSYDSSDKFKIQFVQNFTTFSSIIVDKIDVVVPLHRGNFTHWHGEKSLLIEVQPSLRSILCQVVNDSGTIFGSVNALIEPGFVFSQISSFFEKKKWVLFVNDNSFLCRGNFGHFGNSIWVSPARYFSYFCVLFEELVFVQKVWCQDPVKIAFNCSWTSIFRCSDRDPRGRTAANGCTKVAEYVNADPQADLCNLVRDCIQQLDFSRKHGYVEVKQYSATTTRSCIQLKSSRWSTVASVLY